MILNVYGSREHGFSAHGESNGSDMFLPCPWCKSWEIVVTNSHTPYYQAECGGCGATGPDSPYVKRWATKTFDAVVKQHVRAFTHAINLWNRRDGKLRIKQTIKCHVVDKMP